MRAGAQSFEHALVNFQRGEFRRAEQLCVATLQTDRAHVHALHLLGLIALQTGDPAKAVEQIRRSLDIDGHQPVALMNLGNALLQLGRAEEALATLEAALALRPAYAEALNNRGNALLALKRPSEAAASYQQAVALRSGVAVFHSNLGNALRELKQLDAALASYDRALASHPMLIEAQLGRVEVLRALRRFEEALAQCDECLKGAPADLDALLIRSAILLDLGHQAAARSNLERAFALSPKSADALVSRGDISLRLRSAERALRDYQAALHLDPGCAQAVMHGGHALMQLGRLEEAMANYDRYVALRPADSKGFYYRANALRRLERPQAAIADYARALAIDPQDAEAAVGAGNALRSLDRLDESLASYDRALRLDPCCLSALSNRGRLLVLLDRVEEARDCLDRFRELAPDHGTEYVHEMGMLLQALLLCSDWREYDSTNQAINAALSVEHGATLPPMILVGNPPDIQLRCARAFVENRWGAPSSVAWARPAYRHSKIRLAYVSADFREHPVSQLMAGVFEGHDRERFETFAISLRAPDTSELGRRVRAAFGRFLDVSTRTDQEVAATLRELEVDIAVDLTGLTDGSRPGIFAARGAPVQVNYLGYCGTMGSRYLDYIVADRIVIPERDQQWYAERVAYLPVFFPSNDCSRDIANRTSRRQDNGLPEQGIVFCCFNGHYKIAPPVFDVWMRLLKRLPGSVLWLSGGRASAMRNLRNEAHRRGVEPERVVFAARVSDPRGHLARCRLADLFLDTLPCNAHTTASDALWAGVPVLTCRGGSFAGRVAASLLSAVGLPQLITDSLQAYETLAFELAARPELLVRLRSCLEANRLTYPLFNTRGFINNLETAFVTMWERSRRGESPAGFDVPG